MKHEITIRWGMVSSEQESETYTFDTAEELTAFMLGVDAMEGWIEYEVIENERNE